MSTVHGEVERLVGAVEWTGANVGNCRCPGQDLHTTPTGKRDCRVYLDRVPTIFCFHSSCHHEVDRANAILRSRIGKLSGIKWAQFNYPIKKPAPSPQEQLACRAKLSLNSVLEENAQEPSELFEQSPAPLGDNPENDWRLILQLFEPDDTVWIGDVRESGPAFKSRFRTIRDWLKLENAPGQFICPNSFRPGSYSRSNENIQERKFLVVESDVLLKSEVLAVFSWCRKFMRLRAIVDTANKSLHGWFDFPRRPEFLEELKFILPAR